ncbi:MAG: RHS repeat protein, partial [Kiritimatiellae bacterium]|nr:RHS repeat protein [Kiritimatiellia bacterium]
MRKFALLMVAAVATVSSYGAFNCEVVVSAANLGESRTATVTYFNDGIFAIDAPYVRLEAGDNAYVRFAETDAWSKSVEFLATSEQSPASSLQAGEVVEIPVFVYTATQEAQMTISYTQSSTELFPWSSIGSLLKPSYVSDSAWAFALATLKSRFGTTWNSYLSRLRANADYLAENGRPVRRLDRLLQIEINHALGVDAVLPVLASATDAARSARGMGLSFTRSYSSAMYARFTSGILGYGWMDNLSTCAELVDSKTLVFRVPGGGSYSFTKATGLWQPEDARDKTVLTESSTAYTLTYQSGTVQTFAKSNMRTSSIADNCGNTLTFTWSGTKLQKITHTDGQSLTFAYSGGLLSSVTDDCGRQTAYTYSNSLLTKVTASDGLVTSYEYRAADGTAAASALSRIVYPDGTTREFAYDTSSGLVNAISSNGGKETTTISRDGGVVTLTGPDGAETTVKTGVLGETLETTDALGGISTKGYTEDGLLKSVVSPSGLNGSIEHDALGRVSKSFSAAGTATAFAYEETFGNLKKVTDAKNHAVTYGYDAQGHGTSVTFADGSASKLEYNNRGDVVKSTNRRGQTVTYTYNAKGRVTKKKWSTGRTFTYAYDAHGNVTTAADSETGTVTMQYDSADRLTKITYPAGRGFTFTYDSCGRLAERMSLDGAVEQFAYDASGRLASVADGSGNAYLQNTYDETTGRLSKQVNGNGTSVSYLYDKLGRVVSIEHSDAEGKIVESLQYCYDADGRCIRASSLLGEERYGYDKDGQLTSVRYPDSPSEAFAYDAVGNRTTANGATYTVNNLNQYTAILAGMESSATAITYDKDGNMTSLTDANGTTSYSYDTLNRLVAVSNPAAGINWSCRYDVFGNRVSVTDNGVTTERTYLQGSLPSVAAEYVNGQLKERHIVVGAVRVADITGTTGVSPVESTRYYHADLIGSTRLVTDGNGTIVDRRAYKAFGETRVGNETTSSAGYVGTLGVETDPTGLLFMRNRYYSPTLGRFIQMDPIGLNGGDCNCYRYCENNPANAVDLSAFQMVDMCKVVGNPAPPNGCGAEGDWKSNFIPNGTAENKARCDLHDLAYGTRGFPKAAADEFLGTFYKWAVNKWGQDAYESAQRNASAQLECMQNASEEDMRQAIRDYYNNTFVNTSVNTDLIADINNKIAEQIHSDYESAINVTPDGGSGSTYQDELVDFELPDGSLKEVSVSGSFTISFEWVVQINPQLSYPHPIGYAYFYVDDTPYGLGGTIGADGMLVRNESISVTGDGVHSLRWSVELCTSLPVEYGVRNVNIVRSAKKRAAMVKSAATDVPQDSVQKAGTLSPKALSEIPGAALVQDRTITQSTKAAPKTLLSSAENEATSPRLYCYERYVAVKGLTYAFALSADEDASISVSGLPSGFSFSDGIISGTASAAGTTTMTITANGSAGTTTKHVQFAVIEAPEDFQPIISLLSHPDLRPCMASGWSAPLVVSASEDSTQGATSFLDTDSLYVSWIIDCGNVNAEGTFYTCLYVDDVLQTYWYTEGLQRDYYTWVKGYSLGALSAGTHKVRIVTDATGVVTESDKSNNSFETTITVVRDWFPDLSVSSLSVSRTSIAVSESVTVHWWVESNGDAATDKSKIAFLTYKYDAASDEYSLVKTEWLDCLSLATGGRQEFTKIITGKSLGEGVYAFAVMADGQEAIIERDEADNIKYVAVTVTKDAATSSKSSVDWQFNKIKGEADAFFLSASSDLKKKATTFNVGQPIYMRCCWWNAKKNAVSGDMRVRVMLNGGAGIYSDGSYFAKNSWYYLTNLTPSFLQDLPAGDYTLTAILDSENAWQETDEKNNVKTISFTVIGKPTIASESTYNCAMNVPVSWPVTIYGKETVKGLPSGLTYSNGAISGKATKVGTYVVNVSASNDAGTASKTITIVVEDPGFTVVCSAKPNGASSRDVVSGDTIDMFAGVKQEIVLSATPGKVGVEKSDVSSMSVKGLPTGLKLSGGAISGVPTKPGSYLATITFKNKYGWTSDFDIRFVVSALPSWAVGSFEGAVGEGAATMSVTAAGKVAGKFSLGGTNWTFKADSYTAVESLGATTNFSVSAVATAGKATMPVELALSGLAIGYLPASATARAAGTFGDAVAELYRLVWTDKGDADAASLATGYAGAYSFVAAYGDLEGGVTFTLNEKGAISGAAVLPDGAMTRKVTFAANALAEPDGLHVVVSLPPDAKKGYPAVFEDRVLVMHSEEGDDIHAYRDPGAIVGTGELNLGSGASGTVTVSPKYGQVAAGKTVTLTAKADKGSVFSCWEITTNGVPMTGLDLSSATLKYVPPASGDVTATAKFITVDEDKAAIKLSVDNGGWINPSASTALATNVTCGVALSWQLEASALSATTVKVAGLPAGLKFDAKSSAISGAPTAAKTSDVKITVTTAGKSSVVYLVKLTVDPLPAWAVGSFEGSAGEGS